MSADSIIPQSTQGVQAWDRYAYANNNPVRYTDPTGNRVDDGCNTEGCNTAKGGNYRDYVYNRLHNSEERRKNTENIETAVSIIETGVSIFWEPADWIVTASDCLNGDCSPFVLLGLFPIIPSRAGKYAGETVDTIRGKVAHDIYPLFLGPNYDYKAILPSGLKPDAVDWQNHIVRELKPDNPRAIQRGWNQVKKYLSELFEMDGEIWTGYVDGYQ